MLLLYALRKLFTETTSYDEMNEIILELCELNNSLKYYEFYYEELFFYFWLVKRSP